MPMFSAWTEVSGQMVEFRFQAENVYKAWDFATENLYPSGSRKTLYVRETSNALTPAESYAASTYQHGASFTA